MCTCVREMAVIAAVALHSLVAQSHELRRAARDAYVTPKCMSRQRK
jgi:hypothetical protein